MVISKRSWTRYFDYLDKLRDSGRTNMWGAGAYLAQEYPRLTDSEVSQITAAWMETFDPNKTPQERIDALVAH